MTSPGGPPKTNIVSRVAIEGKARQGRDDVAIKMYLKLSLPLDSVTPGSTVPLFAEENVKIIESQVYPLDPNTSAPYNFSPEVFPLLNNAARALNLPARLPETFASAFGLSHSPLASSRVSNASTKSDILDTRFTGEIVVGGYQIAYVLPKEFPSQDEDHHSRSSFSKRRSSIIERSNQHFMVAIDMVVPYVSRPPKAPFMLSIPTPRCLHNNIKLRIFPPTSTSNSLASLSSTDEDGGSWDLASEPHVTRSATRKLSRSYSSINFADDESSDSSTAGFSEGCGIQGTFPSTERIRVRWARPPKSVDVPEGNRDMRRRVGVAKSSGEMICVVRGSAKIEHNGPEGILMDIEYKGKCQDVWFEGVATLLGMDVSLVAKGSDVTWAPGLPPNWEITGDVGYTGFDVGTPKRPLSRHDSLDSNVQLSETPHPTRHDSTSSNSSLLRAPLPVHPVAEFSFEGSASASSSSSQLTSSMSVPSTPFPAATLPETISQPPCQVITLHLNITDIGPPPRNVFTYRISGTVLVTPRPISPDRGLQPFDPHSIVLPKFSVIPAERETTSFYISNSVDDSNATLEVYNPDSTRKKALKKGGSTHTAESGGRIALQTVSTPTGSSQNKLLQPPRSRTPSGNKSPTRAPSPAQRLMPTRSKRDGPVMIPSVKAIVTPLVSTVGYYPDAYAVRVCFQTQGTGSDVLEFGLAKPGPMTASVVSIKDELIPDSKPPKVEILSISIQGVPVRYETTAETKPEKEREISFDQLSGQEWQSWIKVYLGSSGGGDIVIDYVVRDEEDSSPKGKAKAKDKLLLDVFLPTFRVAVGRLEVLVESFSDLEILTLRSNMTHQRPTAAGRQLLHYSMEELFCPYLCLTLHPTAKPHSWTLNNLIYAIFALLVIVLLYLNSEMRYMNRSLEGYPGWHDNSGPLTITTTVYTGSNWWFGDKETTSETLTSTSAIEISTLTPEPSFTPVKEETWSITATSTPSYSESFTQSLAIIPAKLSTFSWEDLRPVRETFATVFGLLWQAARRVYHYPLEPT
ncbi:hypothetical protein C8J56DRAFT_1009446 [Mycena floridula]|nr:hypothetical protein C8J56DRAFT_1009446 [Mycena floridula]